VGEGGRSIPWRPLQTYKGERFEKLVAAAMKLLRARYLSVREHHDLLAAAGYSEVVILEERRKGWICGVARRPLLSAASPDART